MRKYEDVRIAVWVATAVMTYNAYLKGEEQGTLNEDMFYFKQADIIREAQKICSNTVQPARVAQWYNGDHRENQYNFLRSKGSLRRLTYKNEFNGEKEIPENIDIHDTVTSENGEKSLGDILNFVSEQYTEFILSVKNELGTAFEDINFKEILDFLSEYSESSYQKPDKILNDYETKEKMEYLKATAQKAVAQFKAIGEHFKEYGYTYDKNLSSKWLDGTNTKVRSYFWLELRKMGKEKIPSSISLFAEKVQNSVRFRIALELKESECNPEDYKRHHRFINSLSTQSNEFEFFLSRRKELDLDLLDENKIKELLDKFKEKLESNESIKLQIGNTISYDVINSNSSNRILEIMDTMVSKVKPYYDIAVQEDGEVIEMKIINKKIKTSNDEKNFILYGPPGTGKTYNVINKALEIIDEEKYKDLIKDPSKRSEMVKEYNRLVEAGQIAFSTFHQSYSYEDFVEGLRSDLNGGFIPKDGIFKQICSKAKEIKGDIVSEYNFDESKIDFHKMSLGDTNSGDDSIFEYCIQNNCVALGWGGKIDYSDCNDRTEVRDKCLAFDPQCTNEDFRIDAVNRFKNWIKIGDIIIISYGNYKARAIAKVTGDYYYDDNTEIGFNQFRRVQWLYSGEIIDVKRILKEKNFSQQSIYKFSKVDLDISSIRALVTNESLTEDEEKRFVLVIDEINRGNISKIFGELITLIENDKRIGEDNEIVVTLPYSNDKFGVPSNLYIIGTMNTADRSIALIDTALRRRFTFKEYMPNAELLPENIDGINLKKFLTVMNDRIEFLFDREHTIGHAYFIKKDLTFDKLVNIMKNKIIPLLQEYFYGDWEKIELILGGAGSSDDNNYFISREEIKTSKLFKNNISSEYPSQYKYTIVDDPTKNAFINLYSDIALSED